MKRYIRVVSVMMGVLFFCSLIPVANAQSSACTSPNVCALSCNTAAGETPVDGTCTPSSWQCCKPKATTSPNSQTIDFENPIGSTTIEGAASTILGALRGVIVVLALLFIVIGAVLYVTSAGNEKQMGLAKGALTAAMIGLALGLAAPSFLKEIAAALGWSSTDAALTASGVQTLSQIAENVLKFFLGIIGIFSIIMLVIGGAAYLTAAGDESRIETGKKIVKWAIVGIIVAFASLIIVTQVATLFV